MSGNHSDENLSANSYSEQKAILLRSEKLVNALKICGVNEIVNSGFMPQSFDQNEDTYNVLDDLGIEYNAGFKAGILYAPGHENDVWPYKVENHEFYAVPLSNYDLSGEKLTLDDRLVKEKGLSGSQWHDMLMSKFNEISGKDEPMVVLLRTSISGTGDYLDALIQFQDFALSNNAKFVTTKDLVNMSRTGIHDITAKSPINFDQSVESSKQSSSTGCATCDEKKNGSMDHSNQNDSSVIVMDLKQVLPK